MKRITKKDLKEFIGLSTPNPWRQVILEVCWTANGARAYIRGEPTPFFAGGGGYDRCGAVLEQFLSYYLNKDLGISGLEGINRIIKIAAVDYNVLIQEHGATKSGILFVIVKVEPKTRLSFMTEEEEENDNNN